MRAPQTLLRFSVCLVACGQEVVELYPSRPADESIGAIEFRGASGPRAARIDAGDRRESSAGRGPAAPREELGAGKDLPEIDFADFPDIDPSGYELDDPPGCQKVDFLFVVDNSRSMRDRQDALVRSFPGFMTTVQETLRIEDFHVMAVDTDGERLDQRSPPLSDEECDDALGAGRRDNADGLSCGLEGDQRFMTSDQDDLRSSFACVATAGASGSFVERPVEAALNAISETFNEAGGCNEGFVRRDAILVLIWITDEDDERSEGDPADWRAQLLDAKWGQEDALVLLALVGPEDSSEPSALCDEADVAVQEAPRLHEFLSSFEAGFIGDVCADDYAPFFEDAVSTVVRSCNAFVPPPIP